MHAAGVKGFHPSSNHSASSCAAIRSGISIDTLVSQVGWARPTTFIQNYMLPQIDKVTTAPTVTIDKKKSLFKDPFGFSELWEKNVIHRVNRKNRSDKHIARFREQFRTAQAMRGNIQSESVKKAAKLAHVKKPKETAVIGGLAPTLHVIPLIEPENKEQVLESDHAYFQTNPTQIRVAMPSSDDVSYTKDITEQTKPVNDLINLNTLVDTALKEGPLTTKTTVTDTNVICHVVNEMGNAAMGNPAWSPDTEENSESRLRAKVGEITQSPEGDRKMQIVYVDWNDSPVEYVNVDLPRLKTKTNGR